MQRIRLWLDESLPKIQAFQEQLRDYSQQFSLFDYKCIQIKGVKLTVKSILQFIVWQIRYRFFRESYFLKKKMLVAGFMSLVNTLSAVEIEERSKGSHHGG